MKQSINKSEQTTFLQAEYKRKIDQLNSRIQVLKNTYPQVSNNASQTMDLTFLQKIISAQKDVQALYQKLSYLKQDKQDIQEKIDEINVKYQELSGSVNQLKLTVKQLVDAREQKKQTSSNIVWQFIVPILVAIALTIFNILFTKSCSILSNEQQKNVKPTKTQYTEYNK